MKSTTQTITYQIFSENCPICRKKIKGRSKTATKYNIEVHIRAKHRLHKLARI